MKNIFFDLDNTLYDYGDYFKGVSKEIAERLVFLWEKKTSSYPFIFNDLVKDSVKIFNNYNGRIFPYKDTVPVLKELKKKGFVLGIITDGNPERQKNKIKKLGIRKYFKKIVFAKESEPKPSKKPFEIAIEGLSGENWYVADNPLIDFKGAKEAGMKTVRVRRGEFKKYPKNKFINFEIDTLKDLPKLI